MVTGHAVRVTDLKKAYGETQALTGMNLEVNTGEVFGIVGPNGAGKTTTIDCIAGMRKPDSGTMSVLGMDPSREGRELRKRIGLQQQESELPERLKLRETLELFSNLYGTSPDCTRLLSRVGLSEKEESCFSALSGGQKKRLFVALALVNDPELIILDELTSGLDPAGRRQLWSLVEEFGDDNRTVILSTHYMDEAEKLCDRVAIVDRGRVIAVDTPVALVKKYCPGMLLTLGCGKEFNTDNALKIQGVVKAEMNGEECVMELTGPDVVVPVIRNLSEAGVSLGNLHTKTPTLEDVFLVATGKEYSHE